MRHPMTWCLLLACMLSPLASVKAAPADAQARLIGLWGVETVAPAVEGDLTIDGRNAAWHASIDGFDVPVEQRGNRLGLALPGGQGRFRGQLDDGRGTIKGFWIQPPGMALASAYASPVELRRTQPGVWTGTVRPLPDRLSQYLQIQRGADGALSAFIRNPEFNLARERLLAVTVEGDAVIFTDPHRTGWALHAQLDEDTGQLRVHWQGIGVFAFTRRDRDTASGFFPRTPAVQDWRYRQPLDLDDGWPTAPLEEAGLDQARIAALVAHLQQTAPPGGPQVQGLACDDNDDQSPGNEDAMQGQHKQNDWYRYTLELPMTRDPGDTQAVYCSAGINLLGAVVAQATGEWLPAFFDRYVARPLQMRDYHINLMPTGDAYLAGGIYLRPRDMLKLGQLYLSGGTWQGRRVIGRDWVGQSTARHSQFAADHGYGYGWHLHTLHAGGRDYREYAAEGNGGQFVMVLPELDLTVAITAGNYGDFRTWYALQELVGEYILPLPSP